MGQAESSDYYIEWSYDSNPGQPLEPPGRLFGIPQFLTTPQYATQGNYIRWRIAGLRPLKFKVHKDGYLIFCFTHYNLGSVLQLKCKSGFEPGTYEIRVTNVIGTAIRHVTI